MYYFLCIINSLRYLIVLFLISRKNQRVVTKLTHDTWIHEQKNTLHKAEIFELESITTEILKYYTHKFISVKHSGKNKHPTVMFTLYDRYSCDERSPQVSKGLEIHLEETVMSHSDVGGVLLYFYNFFFSLLL